MASARGHKPGDTVFAIVDSPVFAGARVAIPRGAEAALQVAGMDEGISLKLSTVSAAGRQYAVSADTYTYEGAAGKPKKGVLGRVGSLVHKKHESADAVIAPGSTLTFTLTEPMEVIAP